MNAYLKRERMPSKNTLDQRGVCNGLAMLYAQYSLQGPDKEAEFFTLLNLIASNKIHEETSLGFPEGHCLHFASQILLAFHPSNFEKHLIQSTSMNMLDINNIRLTSSFDFALSTDAHSWCDIFRQIKLQTDEVMVVHSVNHTISVRKDSKGYVVYDRNYMDGVKLFATEEALIRELHNNLFYYKSGATGLALHIVRHPCASARTPAYPELLSLYKQFLSPKVKPAQVGSKKFDSFKEAIINVRDADVAHMFIACYKPNSAELFQAVETAIIAKNDVMLPTLLNALDITTLTQKNCSWLIELAVFVGHLDTFNILIKAQDLMYPNQDAGALIIYAAQGGNPKILSSLLINTVPQLLESHFEELVLEHMSSRFTDFTTDDAVSFKQKNTDQLVTDKMIVVIKAALIRASAYGNVECMKLLINKLKNLNGALDEKDWLQCILAAIRNNQEYSLNTLVASNPKISSMLLSQITLNVVTAANSDLGLLHSLKDNGVLFSAEVDDVFNKKQENRNYSLHTLLMLLIGYIQKGFGKEQIIHDEGQLIEAKKTECQDIINTTKSNNPNLNKADTDFLNAQQQNLNNNTSFSQLSKVSVLLKQKASNLSALHAARQREDVAPMSLDEYLEDDDDCVEQVQPSL